MLDELMTRKSITKLSRTATSTLVLIASPGISSDAISRLESKLSVKWINVARDEDVKSSVQHIVEYNQDGILSNHEKDTFKSLLETFKLKEPEKDHMSNLDERKGMSHKAREIIETMGAWCATQYTSDALSIRLSKKRKTEPVSEIQTQVDLSRDLSQKLQCLLDLVRRVLAKPDFKLVIVVEKRVAAQLLSKLLHHLSFTLLKGVLVAYSLGNRSASMPNVSLRFDKSLDDFRRGLVNTLVISSGVAKMGLM